MLQRTSLALFGFFIMIVAHAQGVLLSGKVVNENNEPLGGISILIDGAKGTVSNADGSFLISLDPEEKHELVFSAVGYETKIIGEVRVMQDKVNELNVILKMASRQEAGIIITTRTTQKRETVNSLLQFQKNTNTVASVISAESIRRSPDRNTGEVLKRTPGASIQEGKFIVIRGLADRYNQAMLNGILLGTTEPDRKTFSFDLIPSAMIDNIVINKAFVPEFPGEWVGGLIQVNTRDIPARNFFNIQIGTGFNAQTIGKKFYKDKGGRLDWLGIDDGTRALPSAYSTKSNFDTSSHALKTHIGRQMRNAWSPVLKNAPWNSSFQASAGFRKKIFGKTAGGTIAVNYNRSSRHLLLLNRSNSLSGAIFSMNSEFNDDRYVSEITTGALGSLSLYLNTRNKISFRSILNINSSNAVTLRQGMDRTRNDSIMKGTEFSFKQNTFFTVQSNGEHRISEQLKFNWYGAFNILDGYIPDQRRILYSKENSGDPFRLVISNSLSQQSGSRIYQNLSDYIYTAGGDLSYSFRIFNVKQTVKAGYMFQVKDRLYDAKLFANYLPEDNDSLRLLPAGQVFAPENFGDGTGNKFGFDAIKGKAFRYMANTLLHAGFFQLDNQFGTALRVVWGLRVENYDQLSGSVNIYDPRHTHSVVTDFLPGLNATYRISRQSNFRLAASQTVIRPELRELSYLNLYDFELNASVQGKPDLKRTKVSNFDLRYELYPRAGEVFTLAAFYKYFNNPIEEVFNEGSGGASTFTFQNPDNARSYGTEMELRKKLDFSRLLQHFTFQANAAWIFSHIRDSSLKIDRPLQGQSPYVVNLGLMYDLEKTGLTATLLYNQTGRRIYLVGDISSGAGSPDIYEAPRPLLDLQLSKKLLKQKGELRLSVSDILNRKQYFYQNAEGETGFNKGIDAYRFTRKPGTSYGFSFNYAF